MSFCSTVAHRLLVVLPLLALSASASGAVQYYEYRVTYRGVFSLGQDMPVADLTLQAGPVGNGTGSDLAEVRVEVSSQDYAVVESLYPVRYHLRSWSTSGSGQLVGFESFEKTDRQRHRLYLRDGSEPGVRSFDRAQGAGGELVAQLDAGVRPAATAQTGALFDRLGLMQRIRAESLHDQAEYRLPVTSGRDRLVYHVKVEGTQTLEIGGQPMPAWKVRFDGYKTAADGREEVAHRPVFIWFSQDQERVPLRADARHAVGFFRIELKPGPDGARVARSG